MSDAASAELVTYRAMVAWDADRDDLRAHTVTLAEQRLEASIASSLNCPVEVEPR